MASDFGLAAVMALASRVVREATEPDAVKAALGAVVCLLQPECTEVRHVGPTGTGDAAELVRQVAELLTTAPRTELARVFVARYYTRWAALLLGPSLVSWLSLLSRAHREELFFAHFLDAPPREALEAVASALQSARHTDDDDASDGGASASARLVAATCDSWRRSIPPGAQAQQVDLLARTEPLRCPRAMQRVERCEAAVALRRP